MFLQLVLRLRMSGALPLLPIYSFMAWTGRILLLLSSNGALLPPSPGCKTIQLTTRPNLLPVLRIAGAISLFPHTLSLHELGRPYPHSTARTPNITLPNGHALYDVRERIAVAVSIWNHQATELTCPMNVKKGKAFPLQAWTGPWGSRRLRLQNF